MNIELENFKSWKHKKIYLSPNGITQIKGESGAGKSSIFEAIDFAIYGIGIKIIQQGYKSCKVQLEYNGFIICRTKGPNVLKVTYQDTTYIDDAAQAVLIQHFGDYKEGIPHMKQNSFKSFLSLSPNDKFLFFQQLLSNSHSEEYKQYCKKLIQSRQSLFTKTQATLSTIESVLDNHKEPEHIQKPSSYSSSELIELYTKTKDAYTTLSKQHRIHTQQYEQYKINLEKKKHIQEMIDHIKLPKHGKTLKPEIERLKQELQQKKNISKQIKQQEDILKIQSQLKEKEILYTTLYNENKNKYERLIQEINTKLWKTWSKEEAYTLMNDAKQYTYNKQTISDLKKEMENIHTIDIQDMKTTLENIEQELSKTVYEGKTFSCPGCQLQVYLHNSTLMKYKTDGHIQKKECTQLKVEKERLQHIIQENEKNHDRKQVIVDKIKKMESQLKKPEHNYEIFYHQHMQWETERQKYKTALQENMVEEFKQLNREKERYKSYHHEPISEDIEEIHQAIHTLHMDIQKKEMTYTQYKKDKQSKKQLHKEMESFDTECNISPSILHEEGERLKTLEEKKEWIQQTQIKIKDYEAYTCKYNTFLTYQEKYKDAVMEEVKASDMLTSSQLLLECIKQSESECMKYNLSTFREHVQKYVDEFFEPQSMKIELNASRKTKTGEKCHIELLLFYNGIDYTPQMFSGGEFQRLTIAFNLALSDMCHSSFILMDECTSNLDQDATQSILNGLKKHLPDKMVVMIAHQVIDGLFDHNITV